MLQDKKRWTDKETGVTIRLVSCGRLYIMKKMKMILAVLVLVLVCTACGKNEDKSDEVDENNVVAEKSEDSNLGETKADSKENKIYTLASETRDVSIEIGIPGEFQDTEYTSESWLALEIPREDDNSSIQLMMYLEADTSADVEKAMFEEVNYLISANADEKAKVGSTKKICANNYDWVYITYEMDGLKGYKFWAEMKNDVVLAATIESLGENPKEFDMETFLRQIDETVKIE